MCNFYNPRILRYRQVPSAKEHGALIEKAVKGISSAFEARGGKIETW